MTFLDELYAIGTLTDDHDTEYDGDHVSCDVIGSHAHHIWNDHDDVKENDTSGLVQG